MSMYITVNFWGQGWDEVCTTGKDRYEVQNPRKNPSPGVVCLKVCYGDKAPQTGGLKMEPIEAG